MQKNCNTKNEIQDIIKKLEKNKNMTKEEKDYLLPDLYELLYQKREEIRLQYYQDMCEMESFEKLLNAWKN